VLVFVTHPGDDRRHAHMVVDTYRRDRYRGHILEPVSEGAPVYGLRGFTRAHPDIGFWSTVVGHRGD
jgi:hypothetical protein